MSDIKKWYESERLAEVKKLFASTVTMEEFMIFVELAKRFGANPFRKGEVWVVKYDANKPAAIFLGRDFYRKEVQKIKTYKGHRIASVFSNDIFKVVNGSPHHEYEMKDRGKLLGAYCVLTDSERGKFYLFRYLYEYNRNQAMWKSHPQTMIEKVVESQTFRMAYQGRFGETYDESEMFIDVEAQPVTAELSPELKNKIGAFKAELNVYLKGNPIRIQEWFVGVFQEGGFDCIDSEDNLQKAILALNVDKEKQ